MLAAWMIFPHFVVSSATNFPNSRGCHRFWNAPYVAKLCLHPPIAKARIDCAVELIDDSDKGVLWGDHPVPHYRLVARHKLGDGWHVLQCRGTRIAGHGHGLQLTRPDLLDNCRNGAKHYLQPSGRRVGLTSRANVASWHDKAHHTCLTTPRGRQILMPRSKGETNDRSASSY